MAISEEIPHQPNFEATKKELSKQDFWMRPIVELEEKLLYDEERTKTNLRTYGWSYHRNITDILLKDIIQAYQHKQIFTCASIATQGFGKSLSMLSLAVRCQKILKETIELPDDPEIITSIGKDDTKKTIKQKLVPNCIFFEDEDPFTSGTDSIVTEHALQNLQEVVLRFNNITYLTAAVTKKRMIKNFFSCYLEPLARNDTKRKTYCRVYSGRTLLPLGHIIINILDEDHPVLIAHKTKEREYKERMLNTGGFESISIDPIELEKQSQLLFETVIGKKELFLDELDGRERKRIKKLGVERLKTAMSKIAYIIPGSAHQQKRVIDECWDKIMQLKIEIDIENELSEEEERKKKQEIKEQLKNDLEEEKRKRIQEERENILPVLIQEAYERYKGQKKLQNIQLRCFFEQNNVSKENMNIAIGLTIDRIAEYNMELSCKSDTYIHDGSTTEGGITFTILKKIEDPAFIDVVYSKMLNETRKRITTKKLEEKHLQAWYLRYKDGASLDVLREEFKVKSKSSFSNKYDGGGYFAIVQAEILGHAVEDALVETYYQGFELVAGNSEPDLYNKEKKVMVEVKTRTRREPPKVSMLNNKELDFLDQGKVELCMVNIEPGKCVLEFYSVTFS